MDELTDTIDYNHIEFGYFAPNTIQKFLIYIGQNSFLKRGLFRSQYTKLIFSLKKGPLDIYFRKCAYRIFGENNRCMNAKNSRNIQILNFAVGRCSNVRDVV